MRTRSFRAWLGVCSSTARGGCRWPRATPSQADAEACSMMHAGVAIGQWAGRLQEHDSVAHRANLSRLTATRFSPSPASIGWLTRRNQSELAYQPQKQWAKQLISSPNGTSGTSSHERTGRWDRNKNLRPRSAYLISGLFGFFFNRNIIFLS